MTESNGLLFNIMMQRTVRAFTHCMQSFSNFFLIIPDDTSLFLFNLISKNVILHIFLLMIIISCSWMFQNVPGCSMFLILLTADQEN